MRNFSPVFVLLVPLAVLANSGAAQELANPGFDVDLTGWSSIYGGCDLGEPDTCVHLWVDEDRGGSPNSGALRTRKNWAGGVAASISQCLPAAADQNWSARAWSAQVSADIATQAWLRFSFYESVNEAGECTDLIGSAVSGSKLTATEAWQPIRAVGTTPANTGAVLIWLFIEEQNFGETPAAVYFDDVDVGIFFGDFEFGNLDDWLTSAP